MVSVISEEYCYGRHHIYLREELGSLHGYNNFALKDCGFVAREFFLYFRPKRRCFFSSHLSPNISNYVAITMKTLGEALNLTAEAVQ